MTLAVTVCVVPGVSARSRELEVAAVGAVRDHRAVQRPGHVELVVDRVLRVQPQRVGVADLARGRRRGVDELHARGDPLGHDLAADLVVVVAERLHDRVLARAPHALVEVQAALVAADQAAGLARLAEPAPPLLLLGEHLVDRQQRVMHRGRLAARVAAAEHAALVVVVLVLQAAERVADLVRADQRGQRVAAGRGGVRAARAAVGVAVGDRQPLRLTPGRERRVARERGVVDGDQALHARGAAAAPEAHAQRACPCAARSGPDRSRSPTRPETILIA